MMYYANRIIKLIIIIIIIIIPFFKKLKKMHLRISYRYEFYFSPFRNGIYYTGLKTELLMYRNLCTDYNMNTFRRLFSK